jgi:hypothetical protein
MPLKVRLVLVFTGLLITAMGVVTLVQGKLHDQNYWHGNVFAPFA